MKYICSKCGREHEGRPAIAFDSPYQYEILKKEDKESIATLSPDLCVIRHEDQTDRFIRAVLHQKVIDDCQTLDYGVWVSLSKKSFKDYVDNFDREDYQATYFGFLSNNLGGYPDTISIRSNVVLRGKLRPEVIPHDDQFDHDLVKDYYQGIEKAIADDRVKEALNW